MENKGILKYIRKFILFIFIMFISYTPVYAYEISAHKSLHENIIREYERLTGTPILASYRQALLFGAEHEDDNPRYVNHFLDPIYNRGFKGKRPSSLQWAQNPYLQGNFSRFGGKNTKLFEFDNDYSFERAVYEYVYGDKLRAMKALGHVLHLAEDLTSVPHTRDDAHGGVLLGGKSYYEEYTSDKKSDVRLKYVPRYSSLRELFYKTAYFTNSNFLSKDTIFKKYAMPKKDLSKIKGYYMYNNLGSKLVFIDYNIDKFGQKHINYINFYDLSVMQDYWKHLSYKAVESGVALLGLFFREVEKEKQTGELALANISYKEARDIIKGYTDFRAFTTGIRLISTTTKDTYLDLGDAERYKKLKSAYLADKYYKIMDENIKREVAQMIKRYEAEHALVRGTGADSQVASALSAFQKEKNIAQNSDKNTKNANQKTVKQENSDGQENQEQESKKVKSGNSDKKLAQAEGLASQALKPRPATPNKQNNKKTQLQTKTTHNSKDSKAVTQVAKGQTQQISHKLASKQSADNFNNQYKFLKYAQGSGVFAPGGLAYGAGATSKEYKKTGGTANTRSPKPEIILSDLPELSTQKELSVHGVSKNATSTTLIYDGREIRTSDEQWSLQLSLSEGKNSFRVLAQGDGGSVEESFSVLFDPPPELEINADCMAKIENTCFVLPDKAMNLTISASGDSAEFTVNGKQQDTLSFREELLLANGQSTRYVATAKDEYSEVSKEIEVKAQLPSLRISEYMPYRTDRWDTKHLSAAWIEIKNEGEIPAPLDEIDLSLEQSEPKIKLNGMLNPGDFLVLELAPDMSMQNLRARKIRVENNDFLNALGAGAGSKRITLSYKDYELDSFKLPIAPLYLFNSFERMSGKDMISEHSCSLNAPVDILKLADNSLQSKGFICQSLGKENENRYYLLADFESSDLYTVPPGIYIVPSTFKVPKGKTLKLSAGVALKFAVPMDTALSPGKLHIEGALVLEGAESKPIIFSSANDTSGNLEIFGYENGYTDQDTPSHVLYFAPGASLNANYLSLRNFTDDELVVADGAEKILLQNLNLQSSADHPSGERKAGLLLKAKDVSILSSVLESSAGYALDVVADSLLLKDNQFRKSSDHALRFDVKDKLIVQNNSFESLLGEADIYTLSFAKESIIENNKGAQDFKSVSDRSFSKVRKFVYENNELALYFPDTLHLEGLELFKLKNSKLNFDSDARILAKSIDNIYMSDFNLNTNRGGLLFEDSVVEIDNALISTGGNLHVTTERQSESAGLSLINSKAIIKNTKFKDNDKASIYAKGSELTLEDVSFEGNYPEIENIDSLISR